MIDPSTLNSLVRGTLDQKPSGGERTSKDNRPSATETDSFEQTTARTGQERPESEPITSRDEAEEVIASSVSQIFDAPGSAFAAQAGLDPESVLSLVD